MVNWPLKRFIATIIAAQLALLVLVVASAAWGIDVPALRQLLGFVCLTFSPGLLVLRLLRFTPLDAVRTLLYSAGISLFLTMFIGVSINTLYPFIGIARPISAIPLIITLTVIVVIFCAAVCTKESGKPETEAGHPGAPWAEIFSPPVLLLLLLPLLSVLGSYYLANYLQNNTLLLVLIVLIAVVAILVAFNRFIPEKLYPLAILMIAISLLWHLSLISQYLWGNDIHHEYYYQSLVLNNGLWDHSIRSSVNSMLSITMLAPVYSLLLDMDSVWIFKIVYPLIYSLLPVALFQIFRKQTNARIAFFSVFFFMSFFGFFSTMIQLARQQIAELFFVLFILLLLDTRTTPAKRKPPLIICGLSIVVSHYGLSYLYLFYLVISLILLHLMTNGTILRLWHGLSTRLRIAGDTTGRESHLQNPPGTAPPASQLNVTLVLLFTVFCFAWYMYIGAAAPLQSIVNIGVHTFQSISDLLQLQTRESTVLMAMGLTSPAPLVTSLQRAIFLIIQYFTQVFVIIGVIVVLLNPKKTRPQPEYIALTLVSALLLLLCIVLPSFSTYLNVDRIYHITLFFLAPFCILGGITAFQFLLKVLSLIRWRTFNSRVYLRLTVILILIPYFLFSTSFIYEVTGDKVTSIALDPYYDSPRYGQQELAAKDWLLANVETGATVAADYNGVQFLVEPSLHNAVFFGDSENFPENTYFFLRSINIEQGEVMCSPEAKREHVNLADSAFGTKILAERSKVYDNGGAQIFR